MIRILLHTKDNGIYLGSAMGLGFWSKLDPAGQDSAVTFDSIAQAQAAIASWDSSPEYPLFTHVEVDGNYASIEQCVAVGLAAWNPEGVATNG